jgi:hypothetical protein
LADFNAQFNKNNGGCRPSFVSYLQANDIDNDLHLSDDSCALDQGLDLSAYQGDMPGFLNDLDGISRPQRGAWDIGPFESASGAASRPLAPTNLRVSD